MPSIASVTRLPIWLIHNPFVADAMPAISTFRVLRSIKNRIRKRFSPRLVHTSTVKNRRPQSAPSAESKTLSTSFSDFVRALARYRAVSACRQSCCERFCVPDSITRLECVDSHKRGFPATSAPPTLRLLVAFAVAPVCAGHSHHIFWAISLRCQANSVSGVTMVATPSKTFSPKHFVLAANRRRWSSLNRTRRPPSCSRNTRFSSRR
jgi:hypothetical protein